MNILLLILNLFYYNDLNSSSKNMENNIVVLCGKGEIKCTASFNNKNYDVLAGKNSLSDEKKEGDGTTPIGTFFLSREIFYRSDKIEKPINQNYKFIEIQDNFGWCDDPDSPNYNKFIDLNKENKCNSFENLKRSDDVYDLIIPINYNTDPVAPYKGSAIFIHIQREGQINGTAGCIAFKKLDLIEIVEGIKSDTMIVIDYK